MLPVWERSIYKLHTEAFIMILGSGDYSYQVVKGWGQGPDGRTH